MLRTSKYLSSIWSGLRQNLSDHWYKLLSVFELGSLWALWLVSSCTLRTFHPDLVSVCKLWKISHYLSNLSASPEVAYSNILLIYMLLCLYCANFDLVTFWDHLLVDYVPSRNHCTYSENSYQFCATFPMKDCSSDGLQGVDTLTIQYYSWHCYDHGWLTYIYYNYNYIIHHLHYND